MIAGVGSRKKKRNRLSISVLALMCVMGSVQGRAVAQTAGSTRNSVPAKDAKKTRTLTLQLDADRTSINWTVGVSLRKVHGTFKLKGGEVIADPKSGVAQGEILIDAGSGMIGTGKYGEDQKRTEKWQKDVLDSTHYPAIIFHPTSVEGLKEGDGEQTVKSLGTITLRGMDHPVDLTVQLQTSGHDVTATMHFQVPYVKWGLKNPSSGFTRYDSDVAVDIVAKGRIEEKTAVPDPMPAR